MAIALLLLPNVKAEEPAVQFLWIKDALLLTIEFTPEQDVWIRQRSPMDMPEQGVFGSVNLTLIQAGREITSVAFTERITGIRAGSEFAGLKESQTKTKLVYCFSPDTNFNNEFVINGKVHYGTLITTDLKVLEEGFLAQVVLHGSYKPSEDEFVLVKQWVSMPRRP